MCYLPNDKSFGYFEVRIYVSEMVISGVVTGKCEMPSTDISQENDREIRMAKRQFLAYNFAVQINSCVPTLPFFLNLLNGNVIGTYLRILS